jgi:hypothetical protein
MPIGTRWARGKWKSFGAVSLFRSLFVALFLVLVAGSLGMNLRARDIRVKLVKGRSGRPIAHRCINVWVGDSSRRTSGPLLETQTDNKGITRLHLTKEDTEINSQTRRLACGLLGVIHPVVKYGDTISVPAGYVLCQPHTPGYSWLAMANFSTKSVLQSGVVRANTCGKASASPQPGEVILFVRPLTWWEKLKS